MSNTQTTAYTECTHTHTTHRSCMISSNSKQATKRANVCLSTCILAHVLRLRAHVWRDPTRDLLFNLCARAHSSRRACAFCTAQTITRTRCICTRCIGAASSLGLDEKPRQLQLRERLESDCNEKPSHMFRCDLLNGVSKSRMLVSNGDAKELTLVAIPTIASAVKLWGKYIKISRP